MKFLFLVFFITNILCIQVWRTSVRDNVFLKRLSDIQFSSQPHNVSNLIINVNPEVKYQTMDGFGASLTDASSWLLAYRLDDQKREEVMKDLFSKEGIHISLLRQTIGACDFNWEAYSYDDTPNNEDDFELKYFTMRRDDAYIEPMLNYALKMSSNHIKLMASPWSPPAWMKTRRHLNGNGGILRRDCYDVFAEYFIKYLQENKRRGREIYAITVQNEPQYAPNHYPGMLMSPEEQIEFIGNHLGPKLKRNSLKAKILAFDHNFDDNKVDYAEKVLSNFTSYQYVSGSAFHPYCVDVAHEKLTKLHNMFPNKEVHLTEAGSGLWIGNDEAQFEDQMYHMIRTPRNWGKSMIFWNVALDQNSSPKLRGVDPDSTNRGLILIRSDSRNNVTKNTGYYSMGHTSKFVNPGAVRIFSNNFDWNVENVSYMNPNGDIIMVVINRSTFTRKITIYIKEKKASIDFLPKSAYTLIFKQDEL